MLLNGEQCVREPLLFALVGVHDRNPLIRIAVAVDDLLVKIPHDDDDELVSTVLGERP